ncbi:hypothetical protein HK096_000660, partial [Nowakowskiella sp. JEL0078]
LDHEIEEAEHPNALPHVDPKKLAAAISPRLEQGDQLLDLGYRLFVAAGSDMYNETRDDLIALVALTPMRSDLCVQNDKENLERNALKEPGNPQQWFTDF